MLFQHFSCKLFTDVKQVFFALDIDAAIGRQMVLSNLTHSEVFLEHVVVLNELSDVRFGS